MFDFLGLETAKTSWDVVHYVGSQLFVVNRCIIKLRSGAAGCNWQCGCRGNTVIIQD